MAKKPAATKKAAAPKKAAARPRAKAVRDAATAPAGGMDVQSGMDPNATPEVTIHSTSLHRQFMEADAKGAPEMSKDERELDEVQKGLQVRGY